MIASDSFAAPVSTRSPQPHGPRHPAPRRTGRMWFGVLASGLATIVLAVLFIALVATAISGPDHRSDTRVGQVTLGLFFLGLLMLSVRWAVRTEHRLRDGEAPTHGGLAKSWHASTRAAHYGPISTAIGLALFGGGAIALAAASISDHAQGQRSAYVQNRGTLRDGVATGVRNTEHCGKYSCSYTATVDVTVSPPVAGVQSTVAHYNGSADVITGEHLRVLVDPTQPAYAELPGSPFKGAHTWITSAVMAIFCALITALWVRQLRSHGAGLRARSALA